MFQDVQMTIRSKPLSGMSIVSALPVRTISNVSRATTADRRINFDSNRVLNSALLTQTSAWCHQRRSRFEHSRDALGQERRNLRSAVRKIFDGFVIIQVVHAAASPFRAPTMPQPQR